MKITTLIVIALLLFSNNSYSQGRSIQGIINTLDSIPLIGVEIKVKSTKQIFLTDSTGRFTAICNKNDKLRIKANGFYTQKIKVDENVKLLAINMKLKPGKKQREYAIGYGFTSEADKTSALTNLNSGDTNFSRYSNMYDLLRSMGLQVTNGEVIIRGAKTFRGSNAALIVVDDVISSNDILKILRPIEIESIDVIKDGTSSVYGSRGANGVILIETKKN